LNQLVKNLLTRALRNSGYRLVSDDIPRTHHFALHHLEEKGTVREWQQLLMYASVFERSKDVPGDIAEFGVASGTSLKAFIRMNDIHNRRRPHEIAKKWVDGFDTFEGLPPLDSKIDLATYQGVDPGDMKAGGYRSQGTVKELKAFCDNYQNCRLVQGLFSDTVPGFLAAQPHASFSLIHIDCDIYRSTLDVLVPILGRLNIGGVMLFDEIFHEGFPGETQAFFEAYNLFKDTLTLQFERVESMPWKWFCVRTR